MSKNGAEYMSGEIHHRKNGDPLSDPNGGGNEEPGMSEVAVDTAEEENHGNASDVSIAGGTTKPLKQSGIFGASSNLVNSIVGAGIIGIPYAFKQSGLVAGILLLILVGWMTDKSLRMIVDMASFNPKLRKLNVHTYEDLASFPFGRGGSGFILFNMFILAYGAMVAYLLIIKDTVPTIFGVTDGWKRELIMVITSLAIVVPLSIQRDMASLAFTSLLSVTADIVLVVFVCVYAPIKETIANAGGFGEVLKDDWINPTIFIGLGILSTAMACQHSAFIVSGSLANKTRSRWKAVTNLSLFVASTASGVMGICGYLGFLNETQGDVLNNFDPTGIEANVARGLLAITMFFTYPMESFVARHVLIKLVHNGDQEGEAAAEAAAEADEANSSPGILCLGRRQAWTLGIYLAALIPALIVNDLGPVLSITGSLGGSCVAYIGPGVIFLGLHGEEFLAMITGSLDKRKASDGATGDIELPVAGDANTTMQTAQVSASPREMNKPWWWFPLLMPIWCAIASTGSTTMNLKLSQSNAEWDAPPDANVQAKVLEDEVVQDDDLEVHRNDFCVAIFFIVFGAVAVVAGILSNIYVQVNGIFFSPH
jgi:sodium-coupled neutral amino acid transporter 11